MKSGTEIVRVLENGFIIIINFVFVILNSHLPTKYLIDEQKSIPYILICANLCRPTQTQVSLKKDRVEVVPM